MAHRGKPIGVNGWSRHKRYTDRVTANRETAVHTLTMLRLLHREAFATATHWAEVVGSMTDPHDPARPYAVRTHAMYAGAVAWIDYEMSKIPVRVFTLSEVRTAEKEAFDILERLALAGRPKGGSSDGDTTGVAPGETGQ